MEKLKTMTVGDFLFKLSACKTTDEVNKAAELLHQELEGRNDKNAQILWRCVVSKQKMVYDIDRPPVNRIELKKEYVLNNDVIFDLKKSQKNKLDLESAVLALSLYEENQMLLCQLVIDLECEIDVLKNKLNN